MWKQKGLDEQLAAAVVVATLFPALLLLEQQTDEECIIFNSMYGSLLHTYM